MKTTAAIIASCLMLQGCPTWWAPLPPAGKIGVVAGGAAIAQSATGTALNIKSLTEEKK